MTRRGFEARIAALCSDRRDDTSREMEIVRCCGPVGRVPAEKFVGAIDSVLRGETPSYKDEDALDPLPHDAVSFDLWARIAELCGLSGEVERRVLLRELTVRR